jgi:pimeloyl-ACP methyl ester carboxylesterase
MKRNFKNFNSGTFTSFDKTLIYFEMSGKINFKKTILFLHGLGGNLTAWDPQRKYFEKLGYTTIAVDLRGHGLSGRPKNRAKYTPEILAKDILTFLEKYEIKNFILVGHCLGGMVSLILTGLYKIKPKALILIATTYEFPAYAVLIQRSKILSLSANILNLLPFYLGKPGHMPIDKFRGTCDLSPRRILNDIFYTTAQSFVSLYSNLFQFNGQYLLKNIHCQTLIIHGEKDTFFAPSYAFKIHEQIKNSQLVLLPDANHILAINNPEEVNQAIHKYLQQKLNTAINN